VNARWRPFQRFILRALWREPVRTALTVFSISLGVAVVIAIELAGTAAAGSFRSSLETLTGEAGLEIVAIGGLPEEALGTLVRLPYPFEFSPRVEGFGRLADSGGSVTLAGLDLVAHHALTSSGRGRESWEALLEGRSIWCGRAVASEAGQTVRLTFNDQTAEYRVRGLLEGIGQENTVVMDIGVAQRVLRKTGRLDRIEVRLPANASAGLEGVLRDALPSGATLRPTGARTEENRKMLAAFRWNLRVLSYIALIVGAFLIYNTVAVSVVRRRPEIGILRALGASRTQVCAAFLAEAAFFGAAGTALGLLLGRLMAEGAVSLMAATVESLYVSSTPAPVAVTAPAAVFAFAIGMTVALLSALQPALEASRVSPAEALARGRYHYQARLRIKRDLFFAFLLAAAAAAASQAPPAGGKPMFGYLAALLLIASSALAIPALISAFSSLSATAVRRFFGVEAMLALRSLEASLGRTSVLTAALSTAVAMMVAVGILVGSFRESVSLWLGQQLRADYYLQPQAGAGADRHPTIDPALAEALERLPEVAAVERFRAYDISYNGQPAFLGSAETEIVQRFGKTRFLPGQDRDKILASLPAGNHAIVSEPFASKHRIRPGDCISLLLGGCERQFEVLGVYYDYSNERGYVILDRTVMLKYLPDPAPTSLAIYLRPDVEPQSAREAIGRASSGHALVIHSNRSLRAEAMRVFDRTFAITYALEAIAILVAIMGIAGALLALVIDRRRELALLRFLGGAAGQLRRLLLFEAAALGLLALVVGLLLGFLLALVLIFVINKQSFGWTIQLHWPVTVLTAGLALVYAATVLSALYPARVAVALNPIEVIHEE
jgi:putative ABC transport system permease protein